MATLNHVHLGETLQTQTLEADSSGFLIACCGVTDEDLFLTMCFRSAL